MRLLFDQFMPGELKSPPIMVLVDGYIVQMSDIDWASSSRSVIGDCGGQ